VKKVIAFDLDGTLAPTKSHFHDRMVDLFNRLLEHYEVCVISGGKYELFQRQFLTQITTDKNLLSKLHLMPTSGTRHYKHQASEWVEQYAENIDPADRQRIVDALMAGFLEAGYSVEGVYGKIVEDRESQVSLSTLGQEVVAQMGEEGIKMKVDWDPDGSKKKHLVSLIAPKIPEFEVRAAGFTTIDVTKPGIDKAYGMRKLMEAANCTKDEILYIGDSLKPGGNDYAVKEFGIDCIEVAGWEDTAFVIEGILGVS
jgi:HAD superfamily hydrolase (TIGR01484 family)